MLFPTTRKRSSTRPARWFSGNPDGDVTLVEFFDYNCGYCRRAAEDLNKLIEANPDLRVVLKEFPVLGPESVEAAQVGIAVNEVAPERYGEFHDTLLASDSRVDAQAALAVVDEMGIDRAAVEAAMEADVVQATIEEVYTLANALGLTGTPVLRGRRHRLRGRRRLRHAAGPGDRAPVERRWSALRSPFLSAPRRPIRAASRKRRGR